MMARCVAITGIAGMGLAGCVGTPDTDRFRVIDKLRIDENLINVLVETSGPDADGLSTQYAECVAAQYALDQGFGFARHIRTHRANTGGNWRADAVYSITPALPKGMRNIDAEVAVQNCAELGIPTG